MIWFLALGVVTATETLIKRQKNERGMIHMCQAVDEALLKNA